MIAVPPIPAERRALVSRVTDLLARPGGRALLVGEPGIGKTTVMLAAVAAARDTGSTVLVAKGLRSGAGRPFHGLVDLFAGVADEAVAQLPEVQREALEVALARRRSTAAPPPMALPVAVAALLGAMLARAPVVLALDDISLLDQETLEIVSYVMDRQQATPHPLTLVATQRLEAALSGREDEVDPLLFAAPQVLPVPALGPAGLAEVLAGSRGARVAPAEVAELHRRSGGNPLWAIELDLQRDGSTLSSSVPLSVADLLRARIRALPPAVDELLTAVAAMGTPATEQVLAVVPDGGATLVAAVAAGVLREAAGHVSPAHPLLGTAALESSDPWRLMRLHRRIAEVVTDVADRAYHLDRSCPPGPDEPVAAALHLASVEARRRGAVAAAVGHAQRSLARTATDGADRPRRLVTLAEMLFRQGDLLRAAAVLRDLDLVHLDIDLLDRALPVLLGALSGTTGDEASQQALLSARAAAPADPVHDAVYAAYLAEVHDADPAARRAAAEEAVRVLTAAHAAPVARHRALAAVIAARLDVGDGLDRQLLQESAELEEHLDLRALNDSAAAQHGFYAHQVDDLDGARRSLLAVAQQAEESGEELTAAICAVHLATVELLSGDRGEALRWLARFDEVDPWPGRPPPAVLKLRALLAMADDDRAALDALLRLPTGPGSSQHGKLLRLALRGIDAARHEDWDAAHLQLTGARELAEQLGLRDPGRRHWLDAELGQAQVALRRFPDAAGTLQWLQRIAAAGDRPVAEGIGLRLEGLLAAAQGDLAGAEALLTRSVTVLAQGPVPAEEARSLLELARLLRRRRARRRGQRALHRAADLAERIGDRGIAGRVASELGAWPAGPAETELTRSEWRIAVSVAEGLSNQQVAAAHFISVRTAETHLSAIYRKLQLRSRTELAAWVTAHPDRQAEPSGAGTREHG